VVGPSAVPQLKAGRIRPLAITTLKRSASLPDVPTIAESGLPGFDAPAWNGVLVPARTPRTIIAKLHAEIVKDLKLPDVLERITALGFEPVGNTPEEFDVFLKAELAKWAKVARAIGAKAE
jgi:tripartite-type tricarboxylate transporter receptor subunit TctC